MCVTPYIATDKRGRHIPVPCGHCIECYQQYQNDWAFRLGQEIKRTSVPVFATLTYRNVDLPLGDDDDGNTLSCLCKRDVQLFMKRLRKMGKELTAGMRYFCVGEYGYKYNRAHYHIIFICPNLRFLRPLQRLIEHCWTHGYVQVKRCRERQIKYVTKYVNKIDRRPHLVKPFRLMSRGIGLNFLTDAVVRYYLTTFSTACKDRQYTMRLPRYYRNKLDEYSQQNYYLKRAGLTYSDLLPEYRPADGTHQYFQKYFADHYDEVLSEVMDTIITRSKEFGYQYFIPNENEVWDIWTKSNKLIQDLRRESQRKIDKIVIRGCMTQNDVSISDGIIESNEFLE